MELFEQIIENELTDGVFEISMVSSPAIEENYILLSKEESRVFIEVQLEKVIDKKKKIVCGPILIPDKIIPRDGYDIVFSKDTIEKISQNYLIFNHKDNVSLEHEVKVNNVYMIESWLIEDTEKDKSTFYGYSLPVGTWMGSFKINDDALWEEFIENGVLKGFSIEGRFHTKKVEMNKKEDDIEKDLVELYLALSYTKKDLKKKYKWVLSKSDNNCPACQEFNGQVKTLENWIKTAIPGIPNGTRIAGLSTSYPYDPFGTFCEDNCKCKLVLID